MSGPELLIFDCDGVLIDSEVISAGVQSAALARYGVKLSAEVILARFTGVPDRDMIRAIEEDHSLQLPPAYAAEVKDAIDRAYRGDLQPIEGVREAVRAMDLPVCVASSSAPDKLKLGLAATGLLDLFQPHVFSASQVARGKPAPDIFLFAARSCGVSPEQCIVIEDSVAGVTAARAAGMRVIGFTGASHCGEDHAERLRDAGAQAVTARMMDIPDAIAAAWR